MKKAEIIQEVKEEMCDHYCKYPVEFLMTYEDSEEAHDKMIEEMCAECPLNRL